MARLARIIKGNGAVAGIQIHHAGAIAFTEKENKKYQHIITILFRWFKQQITVSNLHRIREAFRKAARRAVEAGFDIVELHAAHGYLFSQLLSPLKNWRIDRYGGSSNNRRRYLLEVFKAVQSEMRGRALVVCRLGLADGHRGGLSLSEGLATASILEKHGMKLLDASCGSGTPGYVRPAKSQYFGRLHLAHEAKMRIGIPVIGGGGIREPELAEQALQDGMADLIYVGRGILADPGWARKIMEGQPESIRLCRNCKTCAHFTDSSRCPARRRKNGTGSSGNSTIK